LCLGVSSAEQTRCRRPPRRLPGPVDRAGGPHPFHRHVGGDDHVGGRQHLPTEPRGHHRLITPVRQSRQEIDEVGGPLPIGPPADVWPVFGGSFAACCVRALPPLQSSGGFMRWMTGATWAALAWARSAHGTHRGRRGPDARDRRAGGSRPPARDLQAGGPRSVPAAHVVECAAIECGRGWGMC
jgi:hypothetical protein